MEALVFEDFDALAWYAMVEKRRPMAVWEIRIVMRWGVILKCFLRFIEALKRIPVST